MLVTLITTLLAACGVGASSALTCSSPELLEIEHSLTFDRSPDNIQKVQHINTNATARDIDRMCSLFGGTQLNLIGFSYGTRLGNWYASVFPERVGRMLLDSSMNVAGSYNDATLLPEMGRQRGIDELILPYAARQGRRFNLSRDASMIVIENEYTHPAAAAEITRQIHPITSDMNRKRSF